MSRLPAIGQITSVDPADNQAKNWGQLLNGVLTDITNANSDGTFPNNKASLTVKANNTLKILNGFTQWDLKTVGNGTIDEFHITQNGTDLFLLNGFGATIKGVSGRSDLTLNTGNAGEQWTISGNRAVSGGSNYLGFKLGSLERFTVDGNGVSVIGQLNGSGLGKGSLRLLSQSNGAIWEIYSQYNPVGGANILGISLGGEDRVTFSGHGIAMAGGGFRSVGCQHLILEQTSGQCEVEGTIRYDKNSQKFQGRTATGWVNLN
jgi:hypothetical protein